jgi:hypothetical protein
MPSHLAALRVHAPSTEIQSEVSSTEELLLPKFEYCLDDSDPDILVLRGQDGAFVAAFSARGATTEGITEAAREDYRELVQVRCARQAQNTEEHRSA